MTSKTRAPLLIPEKYSDLAMVFNVLQRDYIELTERVADLAQQTAETAEATAQSAEATAIQAQADATAALTGVGINTTNLDDFEFVSTFIER